MVQKLSGHGKRVTSPGKGQNIWDDKQREYVYALYTYFNISVPDKVRIFNQIFLDHLTSCGLSEGLDIRRFKAQYNDRNRNWRCDSGKPATTAKGVEQRRLVCEEITRAATSLQINLRTSSGTSTPARSSRKAIPPTPPTTPVKRARSIARASVATPDTDSDGEIVVSTKKQRLPTGGAVVVVTRAEQTAAIEGLTPDRPLTPRKMVKTPRSSSKKRADATISYELPTGTKIWLTPEQYRQTQEDLVPLVEAVAHPPVPLLFRYHTSECQSPLTIKGFCAGRFAPTIIPPPRSPSLEDFPWSCAHLHLNRSKVATPFISTSNNFVWIVRLAINEMKRGAQGGRISLINPNALDRRAVFHAQPIHRELCKKRPFDNAAFMYHAQLFDAANRYPAVQQILRLDQLGVERRGYFTKLLPAFKADNIRLNTESIYAIAQVCKTLDLDATRAEAISSVVTDIVKGLGLIIEVKSARDWGALAFTFAQAMCARGPSHLSLRGQESLKFAFLDGCRWATGDFGARQKPKRIKTMLYRAKKLGLDSPADILTSELDMAKLSITRLDQKQQVILRGSASTALLAEPDEVEDAIIVGLNDADEDESIDDTSDEDEYALVRRPNRDNERIVYE